MLIFFFFLFENQIKLTCKLIFSEASSRALRLWNRGIGAHESLQIEPTTQSYISQVL